MKAIDGGIRMSVAAAAPTTLAENAGRVAGLGHRRDHHAADGGGIGRTRAGDAAEHHRHQDRHRRQGAGGAADAGLGEGDHAPGDARAVEDRADQDEHRQGEQRILGDARVHVLRRGEQSPPRRGGIGGDDRDHAAEAERHRDRHAGEHQADEQDDEQGRDHLPTAGVDVKAALGGRPDRRIPGPRARRASRPARPGRRSPGRAAESPP